MLFIISLLSGAVFEVMSAYIDLNMTNSYASFLRLCLLYVENRQVLDVHANVWYQHLTTSASPCGCMLGPRRPGWHDDGPYHVRPSWNAAKSKRHLKKWPYIRNLISMICWCCSQSQLRVEIWKTKNRSNQLGLNILLIECLYGVVSTWLHFNSAAHDKTHRRVNLAAGAPACIHKVKQTLWGADTIH